MIKFTNFSIPPSGILVNREVRLGEIIQIKGPSLQAERAFLQAASGNMGSNHYGGEIYINGYPLSHNRTQFKEHIQFIPSHATFHPDINADKQLSSLSRRWSGNDLKNAALKALGLDNSQGIKYSQLGQQQRKLFELARLIACPTSIWVLERPDQNASESNLEILCDLIHHRASREGIIFLTTGDPTPAPLLKLNISQINI